MARTRRRIPAMKSMMWVKLHFHSCTLVGHVGPVSRQSAPEWALTSHVLGRPQRVS